MTRYRTIVADPPWQYESASVGFNKTPGKWSRRVEKPLGYDSMSVAEIAALPVADLADPSGAFLFLWTTSRYLPDAFHIVSAWGFRYRQVLVWHKVNGPPYAHSIAPNHAEFLLFARRGDVRLLGRFESSVFAFPFRSQAARGHSAKPDGILDHIEAASPGPYAELFARRARFGWDYPIGDQALGGVAA